MKLLQTKLQSRSMNTNFYDSFYTVIKKRNEKKIGEKQVVFNISE